MIDVEDFDSFMINMNPIVVLDNCSLLDLYRYSPDTSQSLLMVYREVIENIWLPQQVFEEFTKNYEARYNAQFNQFEKIAEDVKNNIKKFDDSLNMPFFNAKKFFYPQVNDLENIVREKLNQLSVVSIEYEESIKSQIEESSEYFRQNNPKLFIDELNSSGKIGLGFTKFEKIRIFSEGDIRFRLKYPPGYMDEKDKDKNDPTKTQKFGDLVLWKEMLKKSRDDQRALLFITSDVKEDWWQLDNQGKIMSMHPSLAEEFISETELSQEHFLMLPTGKFFNLMVQRIHLYTAAEKLQVLQSMYSLNAEIKASEILDQQNIIDLIEERLGLTASFINDGELQEFVPDAISDVEICDISEFEITDSVFYSDDDNFIIESLASARCDVKVDVPAFEDLVVTYEYDVTISFNIQINIPIKPIEEVIEEDSQPIVRDLEEEELLDVDNIDYVFSDLSIITCIEISSPFDHEDDYFPDDICSVCNINHGNYFKSDGERICESCSKYWDACPGCGCFYPNGSIAGSFCDTCEREDN